MESLKPFISPFLQILITGIITGLFWRYLGQLIDRIKKVETASDRNNSFFTENIIKITEELAKVPGLIQGSVYRWENKIRNLIDGAIKDGRLDLAKFDDSLAETSQEFSEEMEGIQLQVDTLHEGVESLQTEFRETKKNLNHKHITFENHQKTRLNSFSLDIKKMEKSVKNLDDNILGNIQRNRKGLLILQSAMKKLNTETRAALEKVEKKLSAIEERGSSRIRIADHRNRKKT